jgi:branched-chain amino acid transport system permease protein
MVVLGGAGRFFGPLLGAAVILLLHQEITAYTEYWSLVLAVILGALVLLAPGGLMQGVDWVAGRVRAMRPSAALVKVARPGPAVPP